MHDALANFILSLSSLQRAMMTVFIAVVIKGMILAWWRRYKLRQEAMPVTMKLRNGVYVPNGPVQRIERVINRAVWVWLAWLAFWIVAVIYCKLNDISF